MHEVESQALSGGVLIFAHKTNFLLITIAISRRARIHSGLNLNKHYTPLRHYDTGHLSIRGAVLGQIPQQLSGTAFGKVSIGSTAGGKAFSASPESSAGALTFASEADTMVS